MKRTLAILFSIFTILLIAVLYHEAAHQQVYKNFGIDSKITICGLSACTIPDQQQLNVLAKTCQECYFTLRVLQSETEIIGYHALIIVFALAFIFCVQAARLFEEREKVEVLKALVEIEMKKRGE